MHLQRASALKVGSGSASVVGSLKLLPHEYVCRPTSDGASAQVGLAFAAFCASTGLGKLCMRWSLMQACEAGKCVFEHLPPSQLPLNRLREFVDASKRGGYFPPGWSCPILRGSES